MKRILYQWQDKFEGREWVTKSAAEQLRVALRAIAADHLVGGESTTDPRAVVKAIVRVEEDVVSIARAFARAIDGCGLEAADDIIAATTAAARCGADLDAPQGFHDYLFCVVVEEVSRELIARAQSNRAFARKLVARLQQWAAEYGEFDGVWSPVAPVYMRALEKLAGLC